MRRHRHRGQGADTLAQLLEAHHATAFHTACLIVGNSDDAQAAVEGAFLRAWRFRAALGTGAELTPWLYRVVVRSCCSQLRRGLPRRVERRGSPTTEAEAPCAQTPWAGAPNPTVGPAEIGAGDVLRALEGLPVHLRVVVVLRYYSGLAERDVAIALARRPGVVKARLHEAERALVAHLGVGALAPDAHEPLEEAVR